MQTGNRLVPGRCRIVCSTKFVLLDYYIEFKQNLILFKFSYVV